MSLQSPSTPGLQDAVEPRFASVVRDFLAELGQAHAVRRLAPDASLERHLGLGSLERVELISRLETEFQVKLPDSAIADADTIGDVLRAVLTAEGRTPPDRIAAVVAAASLAPVRAPESAANLLAALYAHVESDPNRPHVYVRGEDASEVPITYGALTARAVQIAADLEQRGIGPGDRVALMLPTSPEFFYCFLGVLLAQAIPAPIYPPVRADRLEEFAQRQSAILHDAEAQLLITFDRAETVARFLRAGVPSLTAVINADRWRSSPPASPHSLPQIPTGGEVPALIQYTSGSTGNPKGVLLTHANLLANVRGIGRAIDVQPDDVGVTWLPLYHDMGLIGCWLLSLYFGIPLTVLSPLAFLSRPERWLWAIHSHRATLSVGPNFAYDLCARRIRDDALQGLDLSSWRAALNGSESVRPETVTRFTARFARCGFRAEAMLPVYGLAESTVALCIPPLNRQPRIDRVDGETFETGRRAQPAHGERALAFVSVGPPIPNHEVRVVDAAGRVCAERIEGRILFRGPSSMAGYFRQPEATAAITQDGWLDSGDLGYWAAGELFITGRSKDVILKAGRNLYPQEIESAVAEIDGIRKGCVAAFGVSDAGQGTEKLVVAAETREEDSAAREGLRAQVAQQVFNALGVPADEVVLLPPGSLPKTSSGKRRRSAARQYYEQGNLDAVRPPAAVQQIRLGARYLVQSAARFTGAAARTAYSLYFWLLFAVLLLVCWLLLLVTPAGRRAAALIRGFTRFFLRLTGIPVRAEGGEHVPAGPAMLVSNHASYLDALALIAALPAGFLYVAKKELHRWPVFATFLRKSRHLIVDRYSTAEGVSDTARIAEALERGESVLVFPEGTFTRARGLRPFKLGAFKAAAGTGAPVIPIAIRGSRFVLPDETWLVRRGPIDISMRPAIRPGGAAWGDIVGLRDAAFAEILAGCGEPKVELTSAAIPGM